MIRRIGLLGGTFDPPHIGHLVVADQVRDRLGLDEVWLVVANSPWQKVGTRTITAPERRLAMVEAAVGDDAGVVASAVEMELGGPSYTAVTLDALRSRHPDTEWLVVVGSDAAAGLDTWHDAERLREQQRFVVVNRPGRTAESPPAGWDVERVEIPSLEVSSTELRAMVGAGRSIRHLTPDPVVQLLRLWGLYRQES